ncbi:MAG: GerMN domain-containing protein [Ruminiclostridium sp.]|nr:GerMN domain-containing protein [Ruminiclostridium sp.]
MVEGKDLIGLSGEPLGDMLPTALDADGAPIPGEIKTLTLYFGNSNADKVVAEQREAIVNEGDSVERVIFLELMKGPESKELHPVIPEGTKLLSAVTEDGICTLDLSKEFVDNHPGGTAGESMTLNSIVNSLTELNTVKQVQFLIEGEKREVYTHAEFDKPFSRNTDMIGK